MRIAKVGAFTFTAVCLAVAALALLAPTTMTFCAGEDCSTLSCGSAAFPKSLWDFDQVGDAANCAGRTSASVGLYGLALAGVGLVATAITSRAGTTRPERSSAPTPAT